MGATASSVPNPFEYKSPPATSDVLRKEFPALPIIRNDGDIPPKLHRDSGAEQRAFTLQTMDWPLVGWR